MKAGTAILAVVAALSWPAIAQRGPGHGGSFGSRDSAGHFSYSGRQGFAAHRGASEPGGYAPAPPFRYGSLGPPPAVRYDPPHISAPHIGVGQNGIVTTQPAFRGEFAGPSRAWDGHRNSWDHRRDHDGDHGRDRHRFRGRTRSFDNWYLQSSPGWVDYVYPFVMDPGFYDGADYDNSGYEENNDSSAYNNANPDDQQEYPNGEDHEPGNGSGGESFARPGGSYGPAGEQPPPWPEPRASEPSRGSRFSVAGLGAASAPAPSGPLIVIFKGGRAPEKVQNYMLTAKSLTDLDTDRYEQIPLDQIDLHATTLANRASGLEFRVPGESRD